MTIRSDPWGVALAGCAALAIAMGIGRFAFTPLLPMMVADQGLSVGQGGWLAAANYLGYLAGGLAAVWWRVDERTVIGVSLALICAGTAAMAGTGEFAVWMVLRALAGMASAWTLVFVSAWCLDRLGALGAPKLGSVVFAGVGAGIALAGGACLVLMQAEVSSAYAWLVLGGLALALSVVTRPIFVAGAGSRAPAASVPPGKFRWNRDAMLVVACYGIFGFGYIIPATFVPALAREAVADPAMFGWSWPLFGIAAMLSTLAAARWIAALGNRKVWVFGVLVMATGLAAPVVSRGLGAILFSSVCVGGTFMVVTMAGLQEGRRIGGGQGRELMAAMTSSFAAGQVAGPLAVSWLAAGGRGVDAALIASAVLLVASAGALAFPTIERSRPIEALPE